MERTPELYIQRETAREIGGVNDLVENQFLDVSGDYMAWVDMEEEKRIVDALGGEPRGLSEAYFRARAESQTLRARRLERRVEELKSSLAKESSKARSLEKRNRNLEAQMQSIQASRAWRLLGRIGRVRARLLRR